LKTDSSSLKSENEGTDAILLRKDREEKLRKKRQKIKQHGKGLGKIYQDAVEKRHKGE
jgi:hypothetical protein